MSTIKADNIATLAGVSTSMANAVNGSAKAWVNFKGDGTAVIRQSYNISSLVDNGTGDYTLNFTTAMTDSSYVVVATTCIEGGEADLRAVAVNLNRAFNTGTFSVKTMIGGTTVTDRSQVYISVFR